MDFMSKKPLVKQRTVYDGEVSKPGLSKKRVSFGFEEVTVDSESGSDIENSLGKYNRGPAAKKRGGDNNLLNLFRSSKGSESEDDDGVEVIEKGKTGSGKLNKAEGQPRPAPRQIRSGLSPRRSPDSDSSKPGTLTWPEAYSKQENGEETRGKPKPLPRTSPREKIGRSGSSGNESLRSTHQDKPAVPSRRKASDSSKGEGAVKKQVVPKPRTLSGHGRGNEERVKSDRTLYKTKSRSMDDSDDEDDGLIQGGGKSSLDPKRGNSQAQGVRPLPRTRRAKDELEDDEKTMIPSPRARTEKLNLKDGNQDDVKGRPLVTKPRSRFLDEYRDDSSEENDKKGKRKILSPRSKQEKGDGPSKERSTFSKSKSRTLQEDHNDEEGEGYKRKNESEVLKGRSMVSRGKSKTLENEFSDEDSYGERKGKRNMVHPQRTKEKNESRSMFGSTKSKSVDDEEDGYANRPQEKKVRPLPRTRKTENDSLQEGRSMLSNSKTKSLEESDQRYHDDDGFEDDYMERKGKRITPVPRGRKSRDENEKRELQQESGLSKFNFDEDRDDGQFRRRNETVPSPARHAQVVDDDDEADYDEVDGRVHSYSKGYLDSDDEGEKRYSGLTSLAGKNHDKERESVEQGPVARPKQSTRSKTPTSTHAMNTDYNNMEHEVTESRPSTMKKASSYGSLPAKQATRNDSHQGARDGIRGQGKPLKNTRLTPQRPGSSKETFSVPGWTERQKDTMNMVENHIPERNDVIGEYEEQWSHHRGFQRHSSSTSKMRGPMKAERGIEEMTRSPHLRETTASTYHEADYSPQYRTQRPLGQQRTSSLTNLRAGSPGYLDSDSDDDNQRRNSLDTVTIRQTVFDNWLSRKNVTLKKQLSRKAMEKQKQEDKEKEEKEREKSAKLAFQSWNGKKAEDLKEKQAKLKAKNKEEQDKELEKRIKTKDAKKYFESWKAKKDQEIKDKHLEKKTVVKKKKEKEEEEKQEKTVSSKKLFENWKEKKDKKIKQEFRETKKKGKLEREKEEETSYERTCKSADEFQKWVEGKGKPRRGPPPPILSQRSWVPNSRHKGDCIPNTVKPVIQPPTPTRTRTLSGSARYQTMRMYDY